ncbi:MAG: four helix bundle suffix domain-containing protein [Kiritimatiellae bacterium]|nr:four helix bundle suffix domain-containing protein [Kiritimatiellia bacterium]
MATELFKNSTGYKRLDVYILMNIIQLETLVFCRRFLSLQNDPCGRQFDQMTQAARSGVKNLTEGSERQATSMQTTLKLIDVAKASLCELRDDYLTWLLDKNLPPWPQRSPEAQEVYAVRFDAANYGDDVNYDLARHIIAQRKRFAKWFGGGDGRLQSNAVDGNRQRSMIESNRGQSIATGSNRASTAIDSYREQSKAGAGIAFANAMLILIGRALHMLDRLLKQHGDEFVKEGGFSEHMTAARVEEKRRERRAVDEGAPPCPVCGGVMRVRHGKTGDFWGCTNYPACKGTRSIAPKGAKEGL